MNKSVARNWTYVERTSLNWFLVGFVNNISLFEYYSCFTLYVYPNINIRNTFLFRKLTYKNFYCNQVGYLLRDSEAPEMRVCVFSSSRLFQIQYACCIHKNTHVCRYPHKLRLLLLSRWNRWSVKSCSVFYI